MGSRWGIGILFHAANTQGNETPTPIVPLGIRGGGTILPRQVPDAFLTGGAGTGREWVINVGEAIHYSELIPGKPRPKEQETKEAITVRLDRDLPQLTGRPFEPRRSKSKKPEKAAHP